MSDKVSNNKRIAKNTFFLYLRMIVVLFVSLFTTRVVLNALGIIDYGIYNVVAGFVTMFAFLNTSMINTTQRYYNYERGVKNEEGLSIVYNTAIRIQVILAVVTLVLLETVGLWYINNKMIIPVDRVMAANWIFQFSVFSLVLLILQIPYSSAIIAHEKMDYYAIISIIDAILKLGIALVIPFVTTDKLILYGFLLSLLSVFNIICYGVYARSQFPVIRFSKGLNKSYFKDMLSFSGWNVLESVSYMLQGQGLNMLMNAFWGPVVNAARGIAYQIQGAVNGFSANIATAFRPQLVESYAEEDFKRTENLMFSMSKYCYVMLFIISLPIIIEIYQILDIWLKGTIPDYTIPFTVLVLVNMLINSFNMPLTQTIIATGQVSRYQAVRSIINASPLLIAWLFIKMGFGPTVVFVVTIAISVVNQIVSLVLLHEVFSFSYKSYFKFVILPCLLFSLVSPVIPLIVYFQMSKGWLRLLIIGCVSVIVSLLTAYAIVLNKNERTLMKNKWFDRFINKR